MAQLLLRVQLTDPLTYKMFKLHFIHRKLNYANFRERIKDLRCPGIQEGQKINFFVKVSLTECHDVALSVSVYGYNTVSALFVTPLCSCECEGHRYHVSLSKQ